MPALMIHDIRKEYFDLSLGDYKLTFDDGLYSQFYYYPLLARFDTELIYFIITAFIKPGNAREQYDGEFLKVVKSRKYMYDAVINKNFSHFMTLEEIQQLITYDNVRIGTHSHFHDVIIHDSPPKKPNSQWKIERCGYHPESMNSKANIRSKLAFRGFEFRNGQIVERTDTEWIDFIKYDTDLSLTWFEKNLGYRPEIYSLPFNESSDVLIEVLEGFGFKEFYGRSLKPPKINPRQDIDRLIP